MSNQDSSHNKNNSSSSVTNFAKRHSLGVATVWREISDGELDAIKVRGRTIITNEAEENYFKSRKKWITNKICTGA